MYVSPKTDCPHVETAKLIDIMSFEDRNFNESQCKNCEEKKENWICLICGEFFCSRYINSHFIKHYEENPSHNICLSMMDLSFWCYECDYYIVSKKLSHYEKIVSARKFSEDIPNGQEVKELGEALKALNIDKDDIQKLKYESFIYELKNQKYKKISFLTGAGISTSAGIPDFRSPNKGLFVQLKEKYKLDSLEEFFCIDLFRKRPELYYDFANQSNLDQYEPTAAHWFMSFIQYKNMLNLIITQNIDCLENKTNISRENIVFAHGNILDAHCSNPLCKCEIDLELINSYVTENKVLYCEKCSAPCKHKIIFYGESLPKEFFDNIDKFAISDLCFVMGTSLKVAPVNMLPSMLEKDRTLVLVNMEKVGDFKFDNPDNKDIFLKGSIDDSIYQIVKDCGWMDEFTDFIEHSKEIYAKNRWRK